MPVRLLDTNIVSYELKFHSLRHVYRPHLFGYTLAVSFQTVAELLYGAVKAKWGVSKRNALESKLGTLLILESGRTTCDYWAEIRSARRTQPISLSDAWIAATALAYGLDLVTHNPADFVSIPGLSVITEAP